MPQTTCTWKNWAVLFIRANNLQKWEVAHDKDGPLDWRPTVGPAASCRWGWGLAGSQLALDKSLITAGVPWTWGNCTPKSAEGDSTLKTTKGKDPRLMVITPLITMVLRNSTPSLAGLHAWLQWSSLHDPVRHSPLRCKRMERRRERSAPAGLLGFYQNNFLFQSFSAWKITTLLITIFKNLEVR